jgi:V/A-type H+-transporting ATPase subunit I
MIVDMTKVYLVTTQGSCDTLLDRLRQMQLVHLVPVDPDEARPDEKTAHEVDVLGRAVQLLSMETPAATKPDCTPMEAAEEVLAIHRRAAEAHNRLTTLFRQIDQLDLWGDVRLEQFQALQQAGLDPQFYLVPPAEVSAVQAEAVSDLGEVPGKRRLVAVIDRDDQADLPDSAQPLERPTRDRPSLRAEAARIDADMKADQQRLGELANLLPAMRRQHIEAENRANWITAARGALSDDNLFALQGWVPNDQLDTLREQVNRDGLETAIQTLQPDEDETPPTLIRYPKWARPIKSLLDMLGTVPGYREFDLAPFFMLAMPIFTAMLVGDAGYGLVFMIVGGLLYNKISRAASKATAQLILIFAAATLLWGVLSGNAFGVGPDQVAAAGGVLSGIGHAWQQIAVFWDPNPETSRSIVMQISFILGLVHLSLAHLRRGLAVYPSQEFIAEIGWVGFIFGMFTLVWFMFFAENPGPLIPPMATLWVLVASWAVIVLFCNPDRNPLKRITFGVLGNLMSIPGAFGDMLSYIRLMAVGLASYYIASAFNGLALQMSEASLLAIPATILVLVLAHGLNIALCLVAIFAHGVRLNMLEFSTNAGVQWAGHPYSPFALKTATSEGDN